MPKNSDDRPVPVNIEAERSVLGAILLDNSALQVVLNTGFSSGDFFHTHHKTIFRQMDKLREEGSAIDGVTLVESLYKEGKLEESGGAPYIASLADGMPKVCNVAFYAKIVREKAALRAIAHLAHRISEDALDPGADYTALTAKLKSLPIMEATLPTGVGANGHLAYGLTEFLAAEFPQPEHLVEIVNGAGEAIAGLIPKNSTVMVFSMPHHLKSWWTTSLALACTTPGIKFGKLLVKKPVRTYLVQMEDFPGQLQWRIRQLTPFLDIDPKNIAILPRCDHKGNKIDITLPDAKNVAILKREFEDFGPDQISFDVLRRIINIDLNSPKDSAAFLEQIDGFRYCSSQPTIQLVHHENRKEADIMYASAGSYNLPGWANVMIQFKRKREEEGVSHVEIEVDNKLAQSPEPMRMVLDLKSETPVRLENVEDGSGVQQLRSDLGTDWTVRDLAEALGVHPSNAKRRLYKFMAAGLVEKVVAGKKGRTGGLARYKFVGEGE